MPRSLWTLAGVVVVLALVVGPVLYTLRAQKHFRNFRVVREGVLYRSGQLTLPGLQRILHDYGIRTVVSLRDVATADQPAPDAAEEHYCLANEIRYLRLPPRGWYPVNGRAPVQDNVEAFRAVMADPSSYPVLVHCFAGIHRTGAYCAIYRMEYEHWSNDRALAEMKACGYDNLDGEEDILGYLQGYRPGQNQTPGTGN